MKKKVLFSIVTLIMIITSILGYTPIVNAMTDTNMIEDGMLNTARPSQQFLSSVPLSTNGVVTELIYIPHHNEFRVYHTNNFEQFAYDNNCGPTLATNIISYYKTLGFYLYSGPVINQKMYNEICSLVEYTPSGGTDAKKVYKAVQAYAERAGYSFERDVYWLNTWGDVTRDIKRGYTVIGYDDSHGYFIVGYRIMDGVKQLYVCTGWDNPEYEWINFKDAKFKMESMHVY